MLVSCLSSSVIAYRRSCSKTTPAPLYRLFKKQVSDILANWQLRGLTCGGEIINVKSTYLTFLQFGSYVVLLAAGKSLTPKPRIWHFAIRQLRGLTWGGKIVNFKSTYLTFWQFGLYVDLAERDSRVCTSKHVYVILAKCTCVVLEEIKSYWNALFNVKWHFRCLRIKPTIYLKWHFLPFCGRDRSCKVVVQHIFKTLKRGIK